MEIRCPKCDTNMKIIIKTVIGFAVVELGLICPECQRVDRLYSEEELEKRKEKGDEPEILESRN